MINFKTTMPIIIVLILIVVGIVGHTSDSVILTVVTDGKLQNNSINSVIDTDIKYETGQKYKVTHSFFAEQLYNCKIELVD